MLMSLAILRWVQQHDGYFVISGIPSGEYELNVSMIGYAIHKESISLADSASIRIEVRLISGYQRFRSLVTQSVKSLRVHGKQSNFFRY